MNISRAGKRLRGHLGLLNGDTKAGETGEQIKSQRTCGPEHHAQREAWVAPNGGHRSRPQFIKVGFRWGPPGLRASAKSPWMRSLSQLPLPSWLSPLCPVPHFPPGRDPSSLFVCAPPQLCSEQPTSPRRAALCES